MYKFHFLLLASLVLVFSACRSYQLPTKAKTSSYRMDRGQSAPEDHPAIAIIAPYKSALDKQMNAIIGRSSLRLYKQKPESPLGNWIVDAIHKQGKTVSRSTIDASILNYDGIRIPEITEGPVTLGKMYELMPFENILVVVELSGSKAVQLFDHIAADGGWPISSEVQFILRDNKAQKVTINRKALISDQVYRIAMPDYIANGGGDSDFLVDLPRENTGILIRDLLIQEVRDLNAAEKEMEAKVTGRIARGGEQDE